MKKINNGIYKALGGVMKIMVVEEIVKHKVKEKVCSTFKRTKDNN